MRQLKHHEKKLLRKVSLYSWKGDENIRVAKIMRLDRPDGDPNGGDPDETRPLTLHARGVWMSNREHFWMTTGKGGGDQPESRACIKLCHAPVTKSS